ncbi:glycerophosphodiester phosphodiesterase [Rhizobium sp. CRIBSB]|nr:glycerophosphodiester phosphodiesterase [Rhizobium sp. CRIBSB]
MIRTALALLVCLVSTAAMAEPLIIAHRGASGERPEHTRAAYELAIAQGADFIEPDLVMSRDGVLIVRHENEIGETTDVASHPEFADRRTSRVIDGETVTGWFTEDFTLAELKTLRARERLPSLRPGNVAWDGREPLLTFQEVIDLARDASARTGRTIGLAPEMKHPGHFAAHGLSIEDALVAVLQANGLTGADAPVLVQCFEVGPLKRLAARIDTPLLQLMSVDGGPADVPDLAYRDMVTPQGLSDIALYAASIGVETGLILPRDPAGRSVSPTDLVTSAHTAGLKVVVWTLRAENMMLPAEHRRGEPVLPEGRGDMAGYLARFNALGVDAVFTDFPALARF